MRNSLESCCVQSSSTLMQTLRAIDSGGVGIALAIDDQNRLVGTLSDGDIRRALISGATLKTTIESYIQRNFVVVGPEASRAEALDLMQARLLSQIPIVDTHGVLIGLHVLHDIIGAIERNNWAVVMAGGKGTRLRPITESVPKPMLSIAGRPILERILLHLVGFGIRHVYLSVNYLGHVIEKHFGDGSRFGCRIEYLRETEPFGTGGALSLLPLPPSEPLVVLNGDLVTQVDLGRMLSFHNLGAYTATMGVKRYTHDVPFGCVEINNHQISRLEEKPLLERMINAGVYVLSPQVVARVPRKFFPITDLFEECIEKGEPVGAFEVEDEWIDVGRHDQLKHAREGNE